MHKLTDLCFFLVYHYNLCFHTHHVCKCKPLKHFHDTVKKKKTKTQDLGYQIVCMHFKLM